ncbi:MAG: hypothetical protein QXQ94_07020 [Candidatus Bathyarchaeia archaeon]
MVDSMWTPLWSCWQVAAEVGEEVAGELLWSCYRNPIYPLYGSLLGEKLDKQTL